MADSVSITCLDDFDGDGCTNVQEVGPDPTLGGQRDPTNHWDFYDVWTRPVGEPTGWEQNKIIDLFGDVVGVIGRVGTTRGAPPSKTEGLAEALRPPAPGDETGYHAAFDRGPPGTSGPDGIIDLFNDIVGVVTQFGHDCS